VKYLLLKNERINEKPLHKTRIYFLCERGSYHIDTYPEFSLLYAENSKDFSKIKLPEGIEIEQEVTGVEKYNSYCLAML